MGKLTVTINEAHKDLVNCTTLVNGCEHCLTLPRTMFPSQLALKCGEIINLKMSAILSDLPSPPTPPPIRTVQESPGIAGSLFLVIMMGVIIGIKLSGN